MSLEEIVKAISQIESAGSEFWHDLFYQYHILNGQSFSSGANLALPATSPPGSPARPSQPQQQQPPPSSFDHADDLLYFVRKSPPSAPNGGAQTEDILFVRRKKGTTLNLTKEEIEDVRWKETFYLNLVVQLRCYLTIAICKKSVSPDGRPTMSALSYVTKRVYASPNKTRMDKKGAEYSCSFPLIYFNVEDFEDAFSHVIINAEEYFCVELSVLLDPRDKVDDLGKAEKLANQRRVVVFQGAVGWDALCETFKKKTASTKENHVEYIMMRGPNGKGHAQVAVSIPPSDVRKPELSPQMNQKKPNIMQGLFRFAQGVVEEPEIDQLKSCLTFVNVSWQSIINDVNTAILKK